MKDNRALSVMVRVLTSGGALLAGLAVGASAWASHGLLPGKAQQTVWMACLFAFGHGAVLVALAPRWLSCWSRVALCLLLMGVVLFAGSLIGSVVLGWSTRWAPLGGGAMLLGWLLLAIAPWWPEADR